MSQNEENYSLWIIFDSFSSRTVLEWGLQEWWAPATQVEEKKQVQFLDSHEQHSGLFYQANTVTRMEHTLMLSHTTWFFLKCFSSSQELCINSLLFVGLVCHDSSSQQEETGSPMCYYNYNCTCIVSIAWEVNASNIENDFIGLWSMWLILMNQCHLLQLDF